jgi:anti-anti-sigma factor
MEIYISQNHDTPEVSIIHLRGVLDGSTYQDFIAEAEKLYDDGVRDLLVDMSELTFLSSAGLAALHRIARVFRGEDRSTLEEGWGAFHAMGNDRNSGFQKHIKLLNPNEKIREVLDTVGFTTIFEIHAGVHPAMASFQ